MLYIVSTPIGNPDDITLRALRVLREANAIICEEHRAAARLLASYQLRSDLVELNEHTERAVVSELIARLKRGETLALISDHGTPMLADPGGHLVARAIAANLPVSAIPGASSLLAALAVSGLPLGHFRFVGFLPAKKELRRAALVKLRDEHDTWVVFDTPYRLMALLDDLLRVLGAERRIVVGCNLTLPDENIVRGTTAQVVKHFQQQPFKGEFVIVVEGNAEFKIRNSKFKRHR